jgi:hypothetical protein
MGAEFVRDVRLGAEHEMNTSGSRSAPPTVSIGCWGP